MTREIPLFPLRVVLLPGGVLPLRIFEPRYLAMVRDCARAQSPFGVVLARPLDDDADRIGFAALGTLAHLVDFHTLPDGLLGIDVLGGRRFAVGKVHSRADGLLLGQVEELEDAPAQVVPAQYGLLSTLVNHLVDQYGGQAAASGPAERDDAAWVGWRLAEFLPLELDERQQLLELDDPVRRLDQLLEWLPRFQAE